MPTSIEWIRFLTLRGGDLLFGRADSAQHPQAELDLDIYLPTHAAIQHAVFYRVRSLDDEQVKKHIAEGLGQHSQCLIDTEV